MATEVKPRIGRASDRGTLLHRAWLWNCEIKDLLGLDETSDEIATKTGNEIYNRLQTLKSLGGPEWEWDDVLRDCEGEDHLNGSLDMLYDWADDERVWLGL